METEVQVMEGPVSPDHEIMEGWSNPGNWEPCPAYRDPVENNLDLPPDELKL